MEGALGACAGGFTGLTEGRERLIYLRLMKFWLAMLVWTIICALMGLSILAAHHGKWWWLLAFIVAFVGAIGKIGCKEESGH